MTAIKKVLVANRGEIALRIFRSLKEAGIATVAVFSEADRLSPHVRFADEAICIGPPTASASYLKSQIIINAALRTGAQAIHPGYGFLSENADFARQVTNAGLIFIGPSPESIEIMGSKLEAKRAAANFGVPLVPGTSEPISNPDHAERIATEIGFPVLIKASAGGGGKGMRLVEHASDFQMQLERAKSEAMSAFGDDSVFIEKFVKGPRHIEFQVLGDQHGNIVHLFERECSIQRRHQKVIEEAPSSILSESLRNEMGAAAVNAARSCGYFNAGTVEFILDENNHYYFLEMNTRLQVEHPVTEMVTGVDLVKLQIEIAEGKKLPFRQEDLTLKGHAIEARIYAEDPENQFLPDIGKLSIYRTPQGPGIRVDDGFQEGMEVPYHYDPLLAKLITYASDRQQAIERMIRALDEYQVVGVKTTIPFCRFAVDHQAFRSGNFDTAFIQKYFKPGEPSVNLSETELKLVAAIGASLRSSLMANPVTETTSEPEVNPWRTNRLNG
ncbi:MAG: acetyl-CoA carboxylase biotin carboxylase subunit [Bacteroidetes bacterium]|nr:acetyl-CoA carboxylase biotin carboxylase subunit [Bacteroidota bacterium]